MAKRERGAARTKRPAREQTAAELAAGRANLAKGRASTARARREAAEAEGAMTAGERWAALLDGSLSVRDLDDREVEHCKVRNIDGTLGSRRRSIPSHLAKQFSDEYMRRQKADLLKGLKPAIEAMVRMAGDPDLDARDQRAAAIYLIDRFMGKAPETIRHETTTEFDAMIQRAAGEVEVERDLTIDDLLKDQA